MLEAFVEESPISNLSRRIELAHDVGAAVLDMPNAFDSMVQARAYYSRLAKEQPDLYQDISTLEGQRMELLDSARPHVPRTGHLFSPLKYIA